MMPLTKHDKDTLIQLCKLRQLELEGKLQEEGNSVATIRVLLKERDGYDDLIRRILESP